MKLRQLLKLMSICLCFGCISCGEDRSVFGDNFDFPEMTDENTIQFTVEVLSGWRELNIEGGGGRMAIDWGDGRLQKIENPDEEHIVYKYGNCRKYRVRIWAEELEYCSVGTDRLPVSRLHLGNLPRMRSLYLNKFQETAELDISAACPNLKELGIYGLSDLSTLDIKECRNLKRLRIYSSPKLASLEIGEKPVLEEFYCLTTALTALSLKGAAALKHVDCSNNPNLSSLEFDDDVSIGALLIDHCNFDKIDFLEKLMITEFSCSYNKLKTLHMPGVFSVAYLNCNNNQLSHLSIEDTWILTRLDCHSNCLEAEALNELFESLPQVRSSDYMQYVLSFYDNPGTNTCREEIPFGKGWTFEQQHWN